MLRPRAPDISDVTAPGRPRRQPKGTALYQVVQQNLEAFLQEARDRYARGLPRYVAEELRAYLKCGILAHGFARAECRLCGEPMLVAFSCKRRGICPSCNARRMHNTAAHLVDRVFPDAPLRQWVLTVPFHLRLLLARNAAAFGAMCRIQAEELLAFHERRARQAGIATGRGRIVRGAGVSFPQRFGGSLNLNTHNHAAFVDGVFVIEPGATPGAISPARFQPLPPPQRDEIDAVCDRIATRFMRWLERRGLMAHEPDHFNNEVPEQSALDSCAQLSLGIGQLTSVPDQRVELEDEQEQTEITRLQPPRGRHRGAVVALAPKAGIERNPQACSSTPAKPEAKRRDDPSPERCAPGPDESAKKTVEYPAAPIAACSSPAPSSIVALDAPASRGAPDCDALRTFESAVSRIDWATLLRRVYDIDALACPCGGRLRFTDLVIDRDEARTILEELRLPATPPPISPAHAAPDLLDLPPPDP